MSTPPQQITEILALILSTPERAAEVVSLRAADGRVEEWITLQEAFELAKLGLIEGVGSRRRPLQYFRRLRAAAIPERRQAEVISISRATAVARMNLGTYRQPLREVTTINGKVISEGEVCGYVHAHHGCRKIDGSDKKAA